MEEEGIFQVRGTAKALRYKCIGGVKEGHRELECKEHTQGDTGEVARYHTK